MDFRKLMKNRNFLLLLIVLNFLGSVFAFYTYMDDFKRYFLNGQSYLIPLFPVSFWLYLFALVVVLYIYFNKDIPEFFGSLSFVYCFVYGIGSLIFYPLFMIFVRGFTLYHGWNVIAHAYVGLQALLFLPYLKKPRYYYVVILAVMFFIKMLTDLFAGSFLYFVKFNFPLWLVIFIVLVILALYGVSFYLLMLKSAQKT